MARGNEGAKIDTMTWTNIRLELDRTADFPRGSPSRAYLLRLPLGDDGAIDAEAVYEQPRQATARRFWPSQPDRTGYISPGLGGFDITYESSRSDPRSGRFESAAFRLGDCLQVREPDGSQRPYRVTALESLA